MPEGAGAVLRQSLIRFTALDVTQTYARHRGAKVEASEPRAAFENLKFPQRQREILKTQRARRDRARWPFHLLGGQVETCLKRGRETGTYRHYDGRPASCCASG
jgi:hypothetical protein